MKPGWSRAEKALFALPALILVGWAWSARRVRPPVVAPVAAPVVAPVAAPVAVAKPLPKPLPKATPSQTVRQARAIEDVVAAPDGRSLWTVNLRAGQGSLHQFSLQKNVWVRSLGRETWRYRDALAIAPNGRDLIYGDSGRRGKTDYVEIFDAASGQSRLRLPNGSGTPSVAIAPDGQSFALGYGGFFEIRALSDGHLLRRVHWQGGGKPYFLDGACFSGDGQCFAVSDADQQDAAHPNEVGKIGVFSTRTWKPIATYRAPRSFVDGFAFAGVNQLVLHAYSNNFNGNESLQLHNFSTGKTRLLATGRGHILAVSPDQKWVATADINDQGEVIAEIYRFRAARKSRRAQFQTWVSSRAWRLAPTAARCFWAPKTA